MAPISWSAPARLLLPVWREVCRNIEMHDSVDPLTAILAEATPVTGLLLRRINYAQSALETVAASAAFRVPGQAIAGRIACSPAELRRITEWCAAGLLMRGDDPRLETELRALRPPDTGGETFIGPLAGDGPTGVAVFAGAPRVTFDASQAALIGAVLEPLSVALENDHRMHELAMLREAAEAERGALLARLERRAISDTIIGAQGGLKPALERVALVAGSDVPILIFGETGTGKEVIAREIHTRSRRASGPFFRVNCGAIPPGLIDSQLFGHEKGSFSGATDTRKGWFERADGGTLFLDEVGELPPDAQVRLLRVLQDGNLERVGGQQSIAVDVRIVAATHRDLGAMVREGSFREDLWYRLAVFPLHLPALRERTEDIPALACYFAEKAATRFGLPLALPTTGDLDLLVRYPWPGNVRELSAVIDRAVLLGNGRGLAMVTALGAGGTPGAMSRPAVPASAVTRTTAGVKAPARPGLAAYGSPPPAAPKADGSPAGPGAPHPGGREPVPLDDAMREHIEEALRATLGRVEGPFGAARRLRINPNTLRARMRKLGISPRSFREGPT